MIFRSIEEVVRENVVLTVRPELEGSIRSGGVTVRFLVLDDGSVVWRNGPPDWCVESSEEIVRLALEARQRLAEAELLAARERVAAVAEQSESTWALLTGRPTT